MPNPALAPSGNQQSFDSPVMRRVLDAVAALRGMRWGTNNAAGAATSPYGDVGPGPVSVGAGQAPTIYGNGGLRVERDRVVAAPSVPPPAMGDAFTDITPPPAAIAAARRQAIPRPRQRTPEEEVALDALMARLAANDEAGAIYEGQNRRIGDDSRARALASVAGL